MGESSCVFRNMTKPRICLLMLGLTAVGWDKLHCNLSSHNKCLTDERHSRIKRQMRHDKLRQTSLPYYTTMTAASSRNTLMDRDSSTTLLKASDHWDTIRLCFKHGVRIQAKSATKDTSDNLLGAIHQTSKWSHDVFKA
ncbi:uncharacterized protein CLUP02_08552 [Colletotrichum lupini]|uniref:Uncharacterized protein n=1 Tax=Colletotrichum lupini TaxID=145971 RepID=A0A9Q8WH47_9PEZI|nr:uncharacterized protein CLUP02_08552 [Colletotrichum lupini]UQC83061.1 hypothetical protein CLUP02_08552 [Colletotrichum lupini]